MSSLEGPGRNASLVSILECQEEVKFIASLTSMA